MAFVGFRPAVAAAGSVALTRPPLTANGPYRAADLPVGRDDLQLDRDGVAHAAADVQRLPGARRDGGEVGVGGRARGGRAGGEQQREGDGAAEGEGG